MSEATLAPSIRFAKRVAGAGHPPFQRHPLAGLAREQGDAAAWRAALAQGAASGRGRRRRRLCGRPDRRPGPQLPGGRSLRHPDACATGSSTASCTSRQRADELAALPPARRDRPAGDLRLPVLPRHPVAAHDLQGRAPAATGALRAVRKRPADRGAVLGARVPRTRARRLRTRWPPNSDNWCATPWPRSSTAASRPAS